MPTKPKKPCAYPGCPNLTSEHFCEAHRKERQKQYDRYKRAPNVNKIYGSEWRRVRERYAAAHPLCEKCLEQGKLVPLDEVHHIVPTSRGGTHDESNLMSLCKSCHTKMHIEIGDR